MYELKIQADNELKQYDIAVKGFDDKFFSLAVAVAINELYRLAKMEKGDREWKKENI